jgi:hypothetical protein
MKAGWIASQKEHFNPFMGKNATPLKEGRGRREKGEGRREKGEGRREKGRSEIVEEGQAG